MRKVARISALVLGVQLIASCDTRLPTSSGKSVSDDIERPTIKFTLSAGSNNTVDVGAPLTVSVIATDNTGISTMLTRISNAAQVIGVDTVTFSPTRPSATRIVPVPLTGLSRGDRLTIRATVADGALNVKTDSIIVTIADTAGPNLTVSSTKSGRQVKGGDTLDIRVTASDSSGIQYAGYRLLRVRATDSVLVKAESTFVTPGTRPTVFLPPAYSYIVPDTLLTGNYSVVGFALDRSGVATRAGASAVSFTIIDTKKPTLTFITPNVGSKLNVGDSLLITARLQDNIALKNATFLGVSARGNPALGTADTVKRYSAGSVPTVGDFAPGVRDTTITRYLRVNTPIDTLTDSLIVTGVLTDAANNADTVRLMVRMVSGPSVTFISPIQGDSANRGGGLTVNLQATHAVGVLTLGFRLKSEPGWPTPIDTTVVQAYSPPTKLATLKATIKIPTDAPLKGLLSITPISTDVSGQDGSSTPMFLAVRAGAPPGPRVTQIVAPRLETKDTITISALGDGITFVGFEVRDISGAVYRRDSVAVGGAPSSIVQGMQLNLAPAVQGKRVDIISFAYDAGGRVGYSVKLGSIASQPAYALALADNALIVYGRTYTLPTNRTGTIADVAVDQVRGNVFLSNINYGRLEVLPKGAQTFDANGVIVGSQPWGMTMSRSGSSAGNVLFVANSGGTNISKVDINQSTPSAMKEDLANRLLTRVSFLFKVTEVRDPLTSKIRLTVSPPILFSDRPQYVEQSAAGRLYISTKPTAAAPLGTTRYLDPTAPAPDERFILAFGTTANDPNSYLVANVDNVAVYPAAAASSASDTLVICDHPSGSTAAATCVSSALGVGTTKALLMSSVPNSDIEIGANIDPTSIGLTDTTFAASSGDGQWIAFGEGHKAPFARTMMIHDDGSVPNRYTYASPSINIQDLVNNASDVLYGIALDKNGKTLAVHGAESYFSLVSQPFTQRLQGKKTTFNVGSGVAFHPNADGVTTPQADRLAFVASANGSIEMIDIAYYDYNRGSLATKFNLYGPLRASLPFPGDDPSVKFKLFGLSPKGLVVIDVTGADIAAGP